MDMTAGRELGGNFAHEELVILTPPRLVPDSLRRKLAETYNRYTELGDALVAADSERINRAASSTRQAVEATAEATPTQEVQRAWAAHRRVLRTSLETIEPYPNGTKRRSPSSSRKTCACSSGGSVAASQLGSLERVPPRSFHVRAILARLVLL